jgi:phosphoribosylaminoimidazole carboxylase (NCAIR synthetase)
MDYNFTVKFSYVNELTCRPHSCHSTIASCITLQVRAILPAVIAVEAPSRHQEESQARTIPVVQCN